MEHLVLLFLALVERLPAVDRLLQKRLAGAVSDLEELRDQPARELARREVVIGPIRRYAVSAFFGLLLGPFFTCGLAAVLTDRPNAPPGPAPQVRTATVVVLLLAP